MANFTILGHGQVNGAGASDALFLKQYSGEVLAAFEQTNVMMPMHSVRSINSGKSAQFPATSRVSAGYHTPGATLVGQQVNHAERVITIDDMLVADVFIPEIDEAKEHFDVRSTYSMETGRELASELDKHVLQTAVLAARASATITGGDAGSKLVDAGYATTGATIAAGIFAAAQKMDEKNIPENDRYAVLRPAQYYLMAQTTDVLNRDWGGSGVYSEGSVLKVAGISIVKSNNLPSTNITTGPAKYQGNFAATQGLVFHKSAVGTVKLKDMSVRMDYQPRELGTLIVAKMLVGSGILRPEAAVELASA